MTEKGFINLPEFGGIKEWVSLGCIIYCDLLTNEYWIKAKIKIISKLKTLNVGMELKCKLDYTFDNLKTLLIKTGINFWVNSEKDYYLHYIYDNSSFKTNKCIINLSCNNFGLDDSCDSQADKNLTSDLEDKPITDGYVLSDKESYKFISDREYETRKRDFRGKLIDTQVTKRKISVKTIENNKVVNEKPKENCIYHH